MLDPKRAIVIIAAQPQALRCPRCSTTNIIRKGTNLRLLRGTPIGRTQVHFATHVPRVH